jgi:hypothetical protein
MQGVSDFYFRNLIASWVLEQGITMGLRLTT